MLFAFKIKNRFLKIYNTYWFWLHLPKSFKVLLHPRAQSAKTHTRISNANEDEEQLKVFENDLFVISETT